MHVDLWKSFLEDTLLQSFNCSEWQRRTKKIWQYFWDEDIDSTGCRGQRRLSREEVSGICHDSDCYKCVAAVYPETQEKAILCWLEASVFSLFASRTIVAENKFIFPDDNPVTLSAEYSTGNSTRSTRVHSHFWLCAPRAIRLEVGDSRVHRWFGICCAMLRFWRTQWELKEKIPERALAILCRVAFHERVDSCSQTNDTILQLTHVYLPLGSHDARWGKGGYRERRNLLRIERATFRILVKFAFLLSG